MARAIFISYRREDSEGEAGRLFDDLTRTWGEDSVFMDVAGISPGIDFRKAIDDNVATCGVLLAVIGPNWATIGDGSGQRRLDDANDFVRLEIASALARQIPVIPVLVHDAKMPKAGQLPDNLKDLAFRNSVELSHTRWNSDVQLLTTALGQYVTGTVSGASKPVHAVVPVQLPPAQAGTDAAPPRKKPGTALMVTLALALVVVAGAIALVTHQHKTADNGNHPDPGQMTAATAPAQSATGQSGAAPQAASAQSAAVSTSLPAWVSSIQGTWANGAPVGDQVLNKLQIAVDGGQVTIHAWGLCRPSDCDWGSQAATLDGMQATATWHLQQVKRGTSYNRELVVAVTPADDKLHVMTQGTLTAAGAPTEHGHGRFQFARLQ